MRLVKIMFSALFRRAGLQYSADGLSFHAVFVQQNQTRSHGPSHYNITTLSRDQVQREYMMQVIQSIKIENMNCPFFFLKTLEFLSLIVGDQGQILL